MYEVSHGKRLIQLRVRFVLSDIRMEVIYACHVSPFSGHDGEERML